MSEQIEYQQAQESLPPSLLVEAKSASVKILFNISYWLWRLNPSATVPAMLSSAVDVVKQSALISVFLTMISQLATTGALKHLANAIENGNTSTILVTISSPEIIYPIIWAVAFSAALFYLISILGGGFINSAEYGSYLDLLRKGKLSFHDVIERAGTRWLEMSWTVMLTETIKYGPLGVILISLISSRIPDVFSVGITNNISELWPWLVALGIVGLMTILMLVLTVYTYPVAASGTYGIIAIKRSIQICAKLPNETILYAVFKVISSIVIVGIALSIELIGIQFSSIVTTFMGFVLVPVLHIFKTAIYLKAGIEPFVIPLPIGPPIVRDIPIYLWQTGLAHIRSGLKELANFVLSYKNVPYHIISAGALAIGFVFGNNITSSGLMELVRSLGYSPGNVNPIFTSFALPFVAVDLSFHNWQVSLATTLSGLALMAPVFLTMMFNGFIIGAVRSLVPNTIMFIAAILPHGIIELPSFVIAGSVGLKLGSRLVRSLTRGNSLANVMLHKDIRQAISIVLGLVPFFLIAGLIEAFITPLVMRLSGWY